jgi:hypothetical protein
MNVPQTLHEILFRIQKLQHIFTCEDLRLRVTDTFYKITVDPTEIQRPKNSNEIM